MSLWESFKDKHSPITYKKKDRRKKKTPRKSAILSPPKNTNNSKSDELLFAGECHHLLDEYDSKNGKRRSLSQLSRQQCRKRLGLSIAHRHLSGNCIYRKREDYSGSQNYTAVDFFDYDTTRAVGLDASGKIDIIDCSNEKPIVQDFEVSVVSRQAFRKLKSLSYSRRIAVGMSSGNYHVLDLGQQSTISSGSIQTSTMKVPKRRYYRDLQNPKLRMQNLLSTSSYYDPLDFREIYGWASGSKLTPSLILFAESSKNHKGHPTQWDFLETSSSCMLAAHVDSEHDCFHLFSSDRENTRPTVVIDTSSQDLTSSKQQEHVSSIAFCGDKCLATSHVTWTGEFFQENGMLQKAPSTKASCCVKLWDLRFLKDRQPLTKISIVPSFPHDTCLGKAPTLTRSIEKASAITNLHGTSQSLLVTTESSSSSPDRDQSQHDLMDLGSLQVTRTITSDSVYGVAESHNALVSNSLNHRHNNIEVHNLRASPLHTLSGTKRPHSEEATYDPCITRLINDKSRSLLQDRHGLETQLSCLTMNHNGTAILGGSVDGDLFLWR
jgi:hypothetical protein